jgi:hypothetical protein
MTVRMKTLMIETVTGGWIVRPFQPCADWASSNLSEVEVFTEISNLQQALPRLLQWDSQKEHTT